MHGIAVGSQQVLHATVERGVVEDAVDEVERDIVADDGFLEQANHDEEDATGKHLLGDGQGLANLWRKVAGTDDGSCYELGEEADVEGVVEQRGQRLEVAPIDIDDVAHGLEGEEGDSHGQEDVPGLEVGPHHLRPHAGEEVGVLEIGQQSEVDDEGEGNEPL